MAKVLLGADPGPPRTPGLLRIYLEQAGHQVQEVGDGESVLAQTCGGATPDVLVLDTALPNLDGFQVLARLQAQPTPPQVPILVMSTIPTQLGQKLVESMGATLYLRKPFAFEALRVALDEVLAPADAAEAPPARRVAALGGASPHREAAKRAQIPADGQRSAG